MPAISLQNIAKSFGETRALAGASLHCELGEIHAIVGENGSGKSTLAKIISGVALPDAGKVDVLGHAPTTPAEAIAAGISTIYQEIMVAEELTVWENTFAGTDGLWRRKTTTAEKKRLARETLLRLAEVDIDPDTPVSALPLSVKQWIVIARAVLQKPKLLIFDESSAALDLEATNRLHKEMLALKEAGSCVLLVTHRIAELVKITDSATVLSDGKTVGRLEKSEITEKNLLRLMSADERHSAAGKRENSVISTAHKPALEACNVQLAANAWPLDFKVHAGEIVGIAGLDGAGQSEFVSILAGITPAPAGKVQVWGASTVSHEITSLADAEAAGITYVSGDRKKEGLFPNLSILENFGLALYDRMASRFGVIDRTQLSAAFDDEELRLSIKYGDRSDKITTLSGGNQQKVLIARAFALSPKVIILNDPARGVDIGTKQDLYTHLRDFASNGGAVVYLSTEIEEFLNFADRADVFFEGGIFASFDQGAITEDNLLAAMFGQTKPIVFDEDTGTEGVA
ncbi:MAG: sugar ABC transporter ATP-binding protein [Roseibium sp.]|nr:sugar ABC transporter ATP-binding protein [Roseibium sp.]